MKRVIFILFLISVCHIRSLSGDFALKTNLLYDALLNANIGAEMRVAPKWSVDLSGQVNFWTLSRQRKWKNWMVQPEARYWLCEAMGGHFFAAHLIGGEYNVGSLSLPDNFMGTDFKNLRDNRYQGWFAGAGIGYGYTWLLHKHWSLEAEIGAGWIYSRYDRYECPGCGRKVESNKTHNYFGVTKAAVNLIYVF